jgi:GT2 family glycosyltransferase
VSIGIVINVSIPTALLHPRLEYLELVLEALGRQLLSDDEVVVVDDGSDEEVMLAVGVVGTRWPEGVLSLIRRELAPLEMCAPGGRPWRLASSRNHGVRVLEKRVEPHAAYVFLDADCVPCDNWRQVLESIMPCLRLRSDECAVLFGHTDHEGPRGNEDVRQDPRMAWLGPHPQDGFAVSVALFERGGGGNMVITRKAWEELGGFAEEFDGGFGYEETDLACRAYNQTMPVMFFEQIKVLHKYHQRGEGHFHQMERNRRLFMERTGLSAFARGKPCA